MRAPPPDRAPLVAVTGLRRSARGVHGGPSHLDNFDIEVYFSGYADCLVTAGGLPVHVPAGIAPRFLLDRMDALVLTGGTDVDPARYGAATVDTTPQLDPRRDAFELALLDAALEREIPVLAICRGLQLLNVSRGGTLLAHLDGHPGGKDEHDVSFTAGSGLAQLYGPAATVNSMHHQGVDRVGRDLRVTAVAGDGVIEGLELPGADVLAVQWHPEKLGRAEPVFDWLVAAARRRVPGSVGGKWAPAPRRA